MRRGTFLVAMVSVTLIIPSCIAFAGLFKVHAARDLCMIEGKSDGNSPE